MRFPWIFTQSALNLNTICNFSKSRRREKSETNECLTWLYLLCEYIDTDSWWHWCMIQCKQTCESKPRFSNYQESKIMQMVHNNNQWACLQLKVLHTVEVWMCIQLLKYAMNSKHWVKAPVLLSLLFFGVGVNSATTDLVELRLSLWFPEPPNWLIVDGRSALSRWNFKTVFLSSSNISMQSASGDKNTFSMRSQKSDSLEMAMV